MIVLKVSWVSDFNQFLRRIRAQCWFCTEVFGLTHLSWLLSTLEFKSPHRSCLEAKINPGAKMLIFWKTKLVSKIKLHICLLNVLISFQIISYHLILLHVAIRRNESVAVRLVRTQLLQRAIDFNSNCQHWQHTPPGWKLRKCKRGEAKLISFERPLESDDKCLECV